MCDALTEGDVLLADRAYDSDAWRVEMASHGVWANFCAMPQRTKPPVFSGYLYKLRNLVERSSARLYPPVGTTR
jgi:transposase